MSESKHTPGPWEVAVYDDSLPPVERMREMLTYGSGPVHGVWCPEHPLTRGTHPKPEHAVMACVTGNGPASEANARLIAAAPDLAAAGIDAMQTNGGPVSAEDTVDGQEYVMVRMAAFSALEHALRKAGVLP